MSRIFLSHSSVNNAASIALRDWLMAEGWDDLFLDLDPKRGIGAGERWERALNEAAYRCEAVLFLVSKAWLKSAWCLKEFHLAAKLNKRMFGILIEDIAVKLLPRELTATWQLVDLAKGADHALFRAMLPDGREEHITFSKAGLLHLKTGLAKAGLDPRFFAWPPEDDRERPPYRGLLPMEAGDAGIFFGREAPIIATLDRLRGLREEVPPRFLALLGASGSGKSSFLKAGLAPRLARDDRNFLILPLIRPERAVLSGEQGLVRCLEEAAKAHGLKQARREIKKAVAGGADQVLALLATLVAKAMPPRLLGESEPRPPALILAIDQGEELFQAEGAEESQAFQRLLGDLLAATAPNLIVLFAIRSDSYERLQTEPPLNAIRQQTLSLPPMPKGAYQMVIEGPIARLRDTPRALKIDPRLTAQLLADIEAGGAKDALPLLAFTLERLYLEYGGDGDLKLADYHEIGGITGSIEAAVQQALEAADRDPAVPSDHGQRLALLRRAFIPWLAGIDPDSGSPRRSIARLADIPDESRPLVKHLIDQRLLATDRSEQGEQTIEPAHEALLRQWSLLNGWLAEDFAQLSALEGIKRATRDWLANNRSADWLAHSAGRLEDAEKLKLRPDLAAKMARDETDYLAFCRVAETERKDRELSEARKLAEAQTKIAFRTRIGLIAASLLAAIALGTTYFLYGMAHDLDEERLRAVHNENKALTLAGDLDAQRLRAIRNERVALSMLSTQALTEGAPDRSLKLAIAAWPRGRDPDKPAFRKTVDNMKAALPRYHKALPMMKHEGEVWSVAYSPDGKRIVTASADNSARIWDAATGVELLALVGHEDWVRSAAFSPDGRRVVTGASDNTARVWDVSNGHELIRLTGHEAAINSAIFSPDGKRLLTASVDSTVRLWDAENGAQIQVMKGSNEEVYTAVFSPDATLIATAGADISARLWDAATGALERTLSGHQGSVTAIDFSPDGKRVVTASQDRTARVWDLASDAAPLVLSGHESGVQSAVFSPDGTRVLTASADRTARVWNARTGNPLAVLQGHEDELRSAMYSPDGLLIVTASADRTARLWAGLGAPLATFAGHEDAIAAVAFSPDGMRVVTASMDKSARLWDVRNGIKSRVLKDVGAAMLSPDGAHVVAILPGQAPRLWDANTGAEVTLAKQPAVAAFLIALSRDGARAATVTLHDTAVVWDARTGETIAELKGHERQIRSIAFAPDGTQVVTASLDMTARVWDARTGAEIARLKEGSEINSAAFSPDGKLVVTASRDGVAKIWDVARQAVLVRLDRHQRDVVSAVFSPDGARVVTRSLDNTARLWDARTGKEISKFSAREGMTYSAVFSPDGLRLITASQDKSAVLRDAQGSELGILQGHEDWIYSASFSPDGLRVVTASKDQTARLWDAKTGAELAVLRGHADAVLSAVFSADGRRILTTSRDNMAILWDISPIERGDVFTIACQRLDKDTGLSDFDEHYGVAELAPICGRNAPLPVDLTKLQ